MSWDRMDIEEYADFQRKSGARLVRAGETWWVEARPFFYRPLFPFTKVEPRLKKYPLLSLVGGVLHPVPEGVPSNSCLNLFVYENLQEYSLERLGKKERWGTVKGMEQFRAGRITELDAFVEGAYPAYRSFYDRTRYFYKKERTELASFVEWASTLFSTPKVRVLGAYRGDRLCAVDISYQVEEVIVDDVFFSDTESLDLHVTDFMLHSLREAAAESDATLLFRGFPSGKESLDRSKLIRGAKILHLPAHCRVNPLAVLLGKVIMNRSYRKFTAMTSADDPEPTRGSPKAGLP